MWGLWVGFPKEIEQPQRCVRQSLPRGSVGSSERDPHRPAMWVCSSWCGAQPLAAVYPTSLLQCTCLWHCTHCCSVHVCSTVLIAAMYMSVALYLMSAVYRVICSMLHWGMWLVKQLCYFSHYMSSSRQASLVALLPFSTVEESFPVLRGSHRL